MGSESKFSICQFFTFKRYELVIGSKLISAVILCQVSIHNHYIAYLNVIGRSEVITIIALSTISLQLISCRSSISRNVIGDVAILGIVSGHNLGNNTRCINTCQASACINGSTCLSHRVGIILSARLIGVVNCNGKGLANLIVFFVIKYSYRHGYVSGSFFLCFIRSATNCKDFGFITFPTYLIIFIGNCAFCKCCIESKLSLIVNIKRGWGYAVEGSDINLLDGCLTAWNRSVICSGRTTCRISNFNSRNTNLSIGSSPTVTYREFSRGA